MIDYAIDSDGIATIAWNVTNRPMNVMNAESIAAFEQAMDKALGDAAVTGIVVTSARKEFIVGADLSGFAGMDSVEALAGFVGGLHALMRRMEKGGKPIVAAINGHALGGGFELAMGCHRRIVADDPRIKLGQPEAKVGLIPGGGGCQRLPRLIGIREALPLLLEGKEVNPQTALKLGMIDAVVPADDLIPAAKAWIKEAGPAGAVQPWDKKGFKIPGGAPMSPGGMQTFVAGNAMLHAKTLGNYPAQRNIMSAVYEGCMVDIDNALKVETRWFVATARTPEAKNLIRFFFSMTEANKGGRRPREVPPQTFTKVGVLGAGMMGAGIAHVTAMAGIEVVLLDSTAEQAAKGKGYSEGLLKKRVARGRMDQAAAEAVLARITPTADFADLAGCELVIEAVFEDRAIKAEVTEKADAVCGEDYLFASNTSTLPITGLAQASARPANFIGLHFFSPVDKMRLVEVIRGDKTTDETLARAIDYVKAIRKTPIVVNDSRGFFTSRVFATYVREGLALLAEGVNPALIENAGRMAGMPVGPLALADEVSIELMHKVAVQTAADLGDKYRPGPGEAVMSRMVDELGRIGKKAGKGFYDYPDSGKKHLWPGLGEQFPLAAEQPALEAVQERLMLIQSVETARCLQESVITDPRDADVGSIMGWGFPPARGGVIGQIDTMGVDVFVAACDRLAQTHGERFSPPQLLRSMAADGKAFYEQARAA